MLQVNNTKKVFKSILLLTAILTFTACSSKNTINKDDYTTKKIYDNINKDAIFEAGKKVFIYSGSGKFFIDSYRNNLHVFKPKMIHRPFYAYTVEDKWDISIEEKDEKSYVKLEAKRVVDYDEKDIIYFEKNVHELFWKRLEFFLGLNKTWTTCESYVNGDNALCDSIDLNTYITPNEFDVIKNITFNDRIANNKIDESENDILKEDIDLVLDDEGSDLLNLTNNNPEENIDEKLDILDKEIKELNKQVNENIDDTLEKIEEIKDIETNQ